jgi:histidinol dehydrogenase
METGDEHNTVTQVRIDIAKIEGMLTQVILDHSRRIDANDADIKLVRNDLSAVKDNGNSALSALSARVDVSIDNIKDIRTDVSAIQTRLDNALAKSITVLSPIIAIGTLIYTIVAQLRR